MKPLARPKGPSPPATAVSLCSAEFGRASGGHGTACGIDDSIEERPLLLWLPESSCTLRSCLHCFQTPNVVSFFQKSYCMGLSENIVSLNMVYHQFPYCKFQILRIPPFETNPSHILGQLFLVTSHEYPILVGCDFPFYRISTEIRSLFSISQDAKPFKAVSLLRQHSHSDDSREG